MHSWNFITNMDNFKKLLLESFLWYSTQGYPYIDIQI
jgi:hypothetical protein